MHHRICLSFAIAVLLFTSAACKDQAQTVSPTPDPAATQSGLDIGELPPLPEEGIDIDDELAPSLAEFASFTETLSLNDPNSANLAKEKMLSLLGYDVQINDQLVYQLVSFQSILAQNLFAGDYPAEALQNESNRIAVEAGGLRVVSSQGEYWLEADERIYQELSGRLSTGMQEFLDLSDDQQNSGVQQNVSGDVVSINYEKLSAYVIRWEQLLRTYPSLAIKDEALYALSLYANAYVSQPRLSELPAAISSYDDFAASYPDSVFAPSIKLLAERYHKNNDQLLADLENVLEDIDFYSAVEAF